MPGSGVSREYWAGEVRFAWVTSGGRAGPMAPDRYGFGARLGRSKDCSVGSAKRRISLCHLDNLAAHYCAGARRGERARTRRSALISDLLQSKKGATDRERSSYPNQASYGSIGQARASRVRGNTPEGCLSRQAASNTATALPSCHRSPYIKPNRTSTKVDLPRSVHGQAAGVMSTSAGPACGLPARTSHCAGFASGGPTLYGPRPIVPSLIGRSRSP